MTLITFITFISVAMELRLVGEKGKLFFVSDFSPFIAERNA
jgi:hypothetical protein